MRDPHRGLSRMQQQPVILMKATQRRLDLICAHLNGLPQIVERRCAPVAYDAHEQLVMDTRVDREVIGAGARSGVDRCPRSGPHLLLGPAFAYNIQRLVFGSMNREEPGERLSGGPAVEG